MNLKPLKIVICGVPTKKIPNEEIIGNLKEKNYPATKLTRMQGRNRSYSMVLVEINEEYKSVFNLINCCGLKV